MTTLSFEPLIRPALWLALAALAAVLLAWYAWNRPWAISRARWGAIVGLMAMGTALPLVILLNPTWQERIPPPAGKPLLTVVLDVSGSMSATDVQGGRSRYDVAAQIARECSQRLAGRFDVRVNAFSGSVTSTSVESLARRSADGEVTDLATAIADSVDPNRPRGQAILLVSDGIHNAGGGSAQVLSAVSIARALATPIYTRTLGSDTEVHDLAVRLRSPQQLSFTGQTVPVTALVRKRGRAPDGVSVVLEQEGREIDRQTVTLSGDATVEARFQVREEASGVYRYEVRVEPFSGEVTQVNNYATFLLRVVDEPIRVLLVEGKPYWDGKFLMRTLASDPSIELTSVVRLAPGRLLKRTLERPAAGAAPERPGEEPEPASTAAAEARPGGAEGTDAAAQPPTASNQAAAQRRTATEAWQIDSDPAGVLGDDRELSSYQVVVLGRDAEIYLSDQALANLNRWISRDSGSLVCYRGQPMAQVNQRLGTLLPVQWRHSREARFRVRLTDRGRELRWLEGLASDLPGETLARLPTLAMAAEADDPKPLATVLATSVSPSDEGVPVVTYQPYGGGRVVVVEGAGMWRWAFLPPSYAEHDEVYAALWQSLLRWLVSGAGLLPGQKLALRTDKVTYSADEAATATLLTRDEKVDGPVPSVELRGDGFQGVRTLKPTPSGNEPGMFRVAFGKLPEGRYQARVAGQPGDEAAAQTAFDVRRFLEEQLDLKARPDLMARIASSTGGAVLEDAAAGEVAANFVAHLDRVRPDRVRRRAAWDRWWVLVGMLVVWGGTWGLRRNGGLV